MLPADSAPPNSQTGTMLFLPDFSELMPHLATRGRERVTFLCTVRPTWAPPTSGPGVDDDMVGWAWRHRRGTEHRSAGGRVRFTPGLKTVSAGGKAPAAQGGSGVEALWWASKALKFTSRVISSWLHSLRESQCPNPRNGDRIS